MERKKRYRTQEIELFDRARFVREQRPAAREKEGEKDRKRKLLHAAVAPLHVFDPFEIETDLPPAEVSMLLSGDVDVHLDDDGTSRWSLRLPLREAALAHFEGPKAILSAAQGNRARIATKAQLLFERWLAGMAPPIVDDEAGAAELRTVASWVASVPGITPLPIDVINAVSLRRLRARLVGAVGPSFRGRAKELDDLRRKTAGPHTIVVEARGGMGKSALLAKLLFDLGAFEPGSRVLTAQLDLDDQNLDVASPSSLLDALVAQLDLQVRRSLRDLQEAAQEANRERGRDTRDIPGRHEVALGSSREMFLAMQLSKRLASCMKDHDRVIIVLDTIERGLHRSPELTRGALDILEAALTGLPSTLIVAGRGPIPPHLFMVEVDWLKLDELNLEAAIGVLLSLGIKSEDFARALATTFGRSPLTLRLIARAVADKAFTAQDLDAEPLRAAVHDALTLGFLYRRILDHVRDPRVRRLAHPGFALRGITPEIIEHVLGWVPEPAVRDAEDARALYQQLRAIHDLVVLDVDGDMLRLRPEVRTEMLRLMRGDRAMSTQLARVHEAAVTYFQSRSDAVARAEEIYHLLQQARLAEAEERWIDEAGVLLADADEELEYTAAEWLRTRRAGPPSAEKGGADAIPAPPPTLQPDVIAAAGLQLWQSRAADRIESLLARRRVPEAVAVLGERSDRSGDLRLALLEARTYGLATDDASLAHVLPGAIAGAVGARKDEAAAELFAIAASSARRREQWPEVATLLGQALTHARSSGDPTVRARTLLAAREGATENEVVDRAIGDLSFELRDVFLQADIDLLDREPGLVRGVASAFSDANVLGIALSTSALQYAMRLDLSRLASVLDALGESAAATRLDLACFASKAEPEASWLGILQGARRNEALPRALRYVLDRHADRPEVRAEVADLFAQSDAFAERRDAVSAIVRAQALDRVTDLVGRELGLARNLKEWLQVLIEVAGESLAQQVQKTVAASLRDYPADATPHSVEVAIYAALAALDRRGDDLRPFLDALGRGLPPAARAELEPLKELLDS